MTPLYVGWSQDKRAGGGAEKAWSVRLTPCTPPQPVQ